MKRRGCSDHGGGALHGVINQSPPGTNSYRTVGPVVKIVVIVKAGVAVGVLPVRRQWRGRGERAALASLLFAVLPRRHAEVAPLLLEQALSCAIEWLSYAASDESVRITLSTALLAATRSNLGRLTSVAPAND